MEKKVGAYQFTDEEINDLFGDFVPHEVKYEQLSLYDFGLEDIDKATDDEGG